ncbi:hypothetical protein LZ32DRAFT_604679 [Colletotrichum eremochloae]|nr:hypothetical protein LZ32DRAFT_604679 [Colletotrichum eremochloae]
MPGYTHLQRAQPVRWSQWTMSYAAAFKQDLERLRQVFERVNLSRLGCGALAGNPFRIDRNMIAEIFRIRVRFRAAGRRLQDG